MDSLKKEMPENELKIERVFDEQTTGNCYVLMEGGAALIIDPNRIEKIEKILEENKVVPEMVLLTHEHGDHISGLNGLREKYDFQTVASSLCSERIGNIRSNLSRIFGVYLIFVTGQRVRDYPKFTCEPADITFEDRISFTWREHSFEMVHTPGHSPGSSGVYMDGEILFSGDSLFNDREIVVRFDGGSEEDYVTKAAPYYRSLPENTVVYPGHGEKFLLKEGIFTVAHPETTNE